MRKSIIKTIKEYNPNFFDIEHPIEKYIIKFHKESFTRSPLIAKNGNKYYKVLVFDPCSFARYRSVIIFEDTRPKEFSIIQNQLNNERFYAEDEYIVLDDIIVKGYMGYIRTPLYYRNNSTGKRTIAYSIDPISITKKPYFKVNKILKIFVFEDDLPNILDVCVDKYILIVKPNLK